MNTMVRAVSAQRFASNVQTRQQKFNHTTLLIALWAFMFICAFAVVYVKDLYRRTFIEYQTVQQQQNQAYVDWGKLLLEQSTWSTQARVQTIASSRLNMQAPLPKAVHLID